MNFLEFIHYSKTTNRKVFFFVMIVSLIFTENFLVQLLDINYVQLSPFTDYGMYSMPIKTDHTYPYYLITINGKEKIRLWDYNQQNKHILKYPLEYYNEMKQNHDKDQLSTIIDLKLDSSSVLKNQLKKFTNNPKEYAIFRKWYKRYLEQTTGKKVNSYTVQIIRLGYTDEKNVYPIDTVNLIQYK